MIKVIAVKRVREDKLQEVLRLTKEMVEKTVKEEGCISYEAYQDIKDPGKITMVEAWESQEDLDKHMNSDHFKRLVPLMADFSEGDSEVSILKRLF
ncbi:putative quinol monooxygenase [Clostridium polynesiense]|uniref:putative quinol monooxygenase n=1 Tax=Clostridium polynesiense TaxID=1325933 RepID=UPI00058E740B|nr:putative quinol monooxygenase [Clostridium polynesiense]